MRTTASLVTKHGPAAVTMSQIAGATGIGRATLYKYFGDVDAILDAWHEQHVEEHLARLEEVSRAHADPADRLNAVLAAYARIVRERSAPGGRLKHLGRADHEHGEHAADVAALVHQSAHVAAVQRRLTDFLCALIKDAARAGRVRSDVSPDELAAFCVHALSAARDLRASAAVDRLVAVTVTALRPRRA